MRKAANRSVNTAAGLIVAAACASGEDKASFGAVEVRKQAAAAAGGAAAQEQVAKGDACWDSRGDRAQLQCAIDAWTAAAEATGRWDLWAKLSRAQFLMSDGHMRFDGEAGYEAYVRGYEAGIESGKKAMAAAHAGFAERMKGGAKLEEAVALLGKEHVPAMYWFASNFGRWANEKGMTTILRYKDMIRKVMEHVLELDDDYFFAAPHRYFGAFFAKAPPFAGGDMDKARQHFEEAVKRYPGYLGTFGLYAEFYAVKAQDEELFRSLLAKVAEGDADALPGAGPENRIEKRKAEALLAKAGELF